jgi:hypothetical protein
MKTINTIIFILAIGLMLYLFQMRINNVVSEHFDKASKNVEEISTKKILKKDKHVHFKETKENKRKEMEQEEDDDISIESLNSMDMEESGLSGGDKGKDDDSDSSFLSSD